MEISYEYRIKQAQIEEGKDAFERNMQDKQQHALQELPATVILQVQNQKQLHHPKTKWDNN